MKSRFNIKVRSISFLLAVLMLASCISFLVSAEDSEQYEGDSLNGWYLDAFWSNGSKLLNVKSSIDQTIDVKLTVEYYAPVTAMTEDYLPGTVCFTIPDIGGVKRSGSAFVPVTAANTADSDWNCRYDAENETYIFTNKNTFEKNKALSGGFEMMWRLQSRNCQNDYVISDNPVFTLGSKSTRMSELTFTCNTERDYYNLALTREYLSYVDFKNDDYSKQNFVTYVYKTAFNRTKRARAGELNTYFVRLSFVDDTGDPDTSVTDEQMSRIVVRTGSGDNVSVSNLAQIVDPETGNTVWGFYRFVDRETGELANDSFTLSFPMELENKNSKVESLLYVHYLDDEEDKYVRYTDTDLIAGENLIGIVQAKVSKYSFHYENGNFSMYKSGSFERYDPGMSLTNEGNPPSEYNGRMLSKKIYNGETVSFTIGGRYRMTTSASAGYSSGSQRIRAERTTSSSAGGDIDKTQADLETSFEYVMGDDRLSVLTENRDFRLLESSEYTFRRLVVPEDEYGYEYDIYVSDTGYTSASGKVASEGDYVIYSHGSTDTRKVFDLTDISSKSGFEGYTEGVKAFYIIFHGIVGEYAKSCTVDISFSFDSAAEELLPETEHIKTDGRITNIGFMRVFKTEAPTENICAVDPSSFEGSFGSDLMTLDKDSYGELLYHGMSAVYLRDLSTTLTSATALTSANQSGGGKNINISATGTIIAGDNTPGEMEKFSLYVKIPALLTINRDLSDISLSGCGGTDIYGNAVDNSAFEDNVSYRLFTLPGGEKVIAADFDFSDGPLELSELTRLHLNIPAVLLYTDLKTADIKTFTVTSYTMLQDQGIGKIVAPTNYSLRYYATTDADDFNNNTRTNEVMAASYDSVSYDSIVDEWQDTAEKFVKSYRDDTWQMEYDTNVWKSETTVNAYSRLLDAEANKRATYSYRLSINLESTSSDIVFADVIEKEAGTTWHGRLDNIDFSYAIGLGLVPTVYYSTDEIPYSETLVPGGNPDDYTSNIEDFTKSSASCLSGSVWTAPVDNIRSVVVRLSTENLESGAVKNRQIFFVMNMTAPSVSEAQRSEMLGSKAINKHVVFYTGQGSMEKVRKTNLHSNVTSVTLLPAVVLVTMLKTDSKTGNVLNSATFSFYRDENGTTPVIDWNNAETAQNVPLNNLGELIVDTLEPGTYYYRETTAPAGYLLDQTLHQIILEGSDKTYDGGSGTYNSEFVIENERLTGKIIFTKKDSDDSTVPGLKGAVYSLSDADGISVYTNESNEYQEAGGTKTTFTTDDNGQIIITGLPWGTYYLTEQSAPAGYDMNGQKVRVTVGRNVNVGEQVTENAIVVRCGQGDKEQTASVRLTKYDETNGSALANAWFELEKKNGSEWETVDGCEYLKTAKNGTVTVDDLKFGTYRFKEKIAPTGYVLDTLDRYSDEITLSASTVGTIQKVSKTNERITGSAALRKYSDDDIPLNGAVFDLYMVNGEIDPAGTLSDGTTYGGAPAGDPEDTPIRVQMRTKTINSQAGMLPTVTGLDWGTYYFREFSAPGGYIKDDTIYMFEITAENAAVTFDSFRPVNDRRKGEVILKKTAGDPVASYSVGDALPGAEFTLCTTNGTAVAVKAESAHYSVCDSTDPDATYKMVTDSAGQINIKNIPWGGYYLEETRAPSGFALCDKVRFVVNSVSCLAVQKLEAEDKQMMCLIRIDKEIDARREDFGIPSFTFRIKKTDSPQADYTRMITLTGDSLSGSAVAQVPAGIYRVDEVPTRRYKLTGTEYVTDASALTGTTATDCRIDGVEQSSKDGGSYFTFTLGSDGSTPQSAEVKFTNTLKDYSTLGHTAAAVNIIPSRRRITGFALNLKNEYIDCNEQNEISSYTVQLSDVEGTISYDDGTTESMDSTQLAKVTLSDNTIDIGYLKAGQSYPVSAEYTDPDTLKSYNASFIVTVGPYVVVESQKVIFRSDENNACVFNIDGRQLGINTVYYNDNDEKTAKVAVSGSYVKPIVAAGNDSLAHWEIVSADIDGLAGEKLSANEASVTNLLQRRYKDGLRTLELRAVLGNPVYDFPYTGTVEEFIAPKSGIYFLEGWGAQGGSVHDDSDGRTDDYAGKGGYSYGYVYLNEGQKLYLAVGGAGQTNGQRSGGAGGFNGGGKGGTGAVNGSTEYIGGSGGGGATHFALTLDGSGVLSAYKSDQSNVLLVAGGGGGCSCGNTTPDKNSGGYGGGESGGPAKSYGGNVTYGASQTTGYIFGQGQNGNQAVFASCGAEGNGGGGGGWYGGWSLQTTGGNTNSGGSGGSGHVNNTALITGETIGGNNTFKAPDGSDETGHSGSGYARITYVENTVDIPYTGSVGSFTAPLAGYYKLEGWGAAGGGSKKGKDTIYPATIDQTNKDKVLTDNEGGRGGYSSGYVYLTAGQKIYFAVGGKGNTLTYEKDVNHASLPQYISGGYNGGGTAKQIDGSGYYYNGSGGGATHFAYALIGDSGDVLSAYSAADDQSKVLLVAGGGGGSSYYLNTGGGGGKHVGSGGFGGGETGGNNYNNNSNNNTLQTAYGGTQSQVSTSNNYGSFGQGANGHNIQWGTGGGGGYYGGGASPIQGGGGGSSYIGSADLINGQTIAGNTVDYTTTDGTVISPELMPTHPGAIVDSGIVGQTSTDETMIGNRGDGYARVTYIPYTEPMDYSYKSNVQSFTASVAGYYKLEAWGASGGNADQTDQESIGYIKGGKGGYSYGTVYLNAHQTVYLTVGGEGESIVFRVNNVPQTSYSTLTRGGGYNGGGDAYVYGTDRYKYVGGGGGATHFALTMQGTGVLSDYENVKDTDVLLVAGGGGGSLYSSGSTWRYAAYGGYGGGLNGGNGKVINSMDNSFVDKEIPGGTQEQQTNTGKYNYGTFGQGTDANSSRVDAGGGGGWYGGGKGIDVNTGMSGGGGSGHYNADALMGDTPGTDFDTIGGDMTFLSPSGSPETGHTGNGYARVSFVDAPDVLTYEYTGEVQTFTATKAGRYRFEAWGAEGGDGLSDGTAHHTQGLGAYTCGEIILNKGSIVYIYVGGKGTNAIEKQESPGGWNGGGRGFPDGDNDHGGGGGGATDFRLVRDTDETVWDNFNSLKSRIMVAGAGGGASWAVNYGGHVNPVAGSGGTINGLDGCMGKGGSQDGSVGYFGKGKDGNDNPSGLSYANNDGIAGSGSGYYGGDIDYSSSGLQNAGGGSSFISGYTDCNAIAESSTEGSIIHTNQPDHYSGMVFTNAEMIDGASEMTDPDGTTVTGHSGSGYARITFLG